MAEEPRRHEASYGACSAPDGAAERRPAIGRSVVDARSRRRIVAVAAMAAFSAATVLVAMGGRGGRVGALLEAAAQDGSLAPAAANASNVTVEASPEEIAASARAGLEHALDKNSVRSDWILALGNTRHVLAANGGRDECRHHIHPARLYSIHLIARGQEGQRDASSHDADSSHHRPLPPSSLVLLPLSCPLPVDALQVDSFAYARSSPGVPMVPEVATDPARVAYERAVAAAAPAKPPCGCMVVVTADDACPCQGQRQVQESSEEEEEHPAVVATVPEGAYTADAPDALSALQQMTQDVVSDSNMIQDLGQQQQQLANQQVESRIPCPPPTPPQMREEVL
jgi:hypothetical protein